MELEAKGLVYRGGLVVNYYWRVSEKGLAVAYSTEPAAAARQVLDLGLRKDSFGSPCRDSVREGFSCRKACEGSSPSIYIKV